MDYKIIIIVILIALYILYQKRPISEKYISISSDDYIDELDLTAKDPATITKLKEIILTNPSLADVATIEYNDLGTTTRDKGEIRPFNEAQILVSNALSESGKLNDDLYDNPYYQLSNNNKNISRCTNFKHVNQCMSMCDGINDCTGFYIDSPNKCCMLNEPPFVSNRNNFRELTVDKLRRRADIANTSKEIYDYIYDDHGNGVYRVTKTREECKSICPKCIMGRCPKDYRCRNMTADPRYNQSCMITNEDKYNEYTGDTYDGIHVPYLDVKYGLDQYPGYHDFNKDSIKIDPHIPTTHELENVYTNYDKYKIAPYTYGYVYKKPEYDG